MDKASEKPFRYICEDTRNVTWLEPLVTLVMRLREWPSKPSLMLWGIFLAIALTTLYQSQIIGGTGWELVVYASAGVVTLLLILIGALFHLQRERIIALPWWLQAHDNSALLEWRQPPRHPEPSVKRVRYVANCPICSETMVATSGGREFSGRLVGRCINAPNEHVYSFDHVTRHGKPLRPIMHYNDDADRAIKRLE